MSFITLNDYINNKITIADNNKLTIKNIYNLYENIKRPHDIILVLNNVGNNIPYNFANYKLINLIKNLDQTIHTNIFIFNGDICMPPIKTNIMLIWSNKNNYHPHLPINDNTYIHIPYTETLQIEQMNIPFDSKLDYNVYDYITSNVTIYCNNLYKNHPNINFVPIGVQIHSKASVGARFEHIQFDLNEIKNTYTINDKNILCYFNCTIGNKSTEFVNFQYGNIRELCYENLKDKPFIFWESYDSINGNNELEKFKNYYRRLCQSKFCICPPNFVPDSYRIWDCIYMGCIPIVLKYYSNNYTDNLPIYFIDNYTDFIELTEDKLNTIWFNMINKTYNYSKLDINYFEQLIISNNK